MFLRRALCIAGLVVFATLSVLAQERQDQAIERIERTLKSLDERLKRLESEQTAKAPTPSGDETAELRRQLELLADEVEKLRSGEQGREVTPDEARSLGLGPAAASVYEKASGVSIAGYGEMVYQNFGKTDQSGAVTGRSSEIDFLRAIVYTGYRFNDKFIFNSEIEVEHADEVSVEFAYLDYQFRPSLILRGGMLLVPVGLVNEYHEPTVFLGARRPETETALIPTTWRENGAGVLGSAGPLSYRFYVVNGLDAAGFTAQGLRGGRQGGSRARVSDVGVVGRLDATPSPGLLVGGSVYSGGSDQGQILLADDPTDVRTTIAEAHAQFQARGLDLRALYAESRMPEAGRLSQALGLGADAGIAKRMIGGYAQAGYNLLARRSDSLELTPFFRYERVNTQKDLAEGFLPALAQNRTLHTLGLELSPIPNIVLKTDYQWIRNRAKTGVNQFNIGLGYVF